MNSENQPAASGCPMGGRLSRRAILGLLGAGAAGAGATVALQQTLSTEAGAASSGKLYPFHGEHQAGIVTEAQDRLHFAAFTVEDITRQELEELLRDWTEAAAQMTRGEAAGRGAVGGSYVAPPDDTGEALDLPAGGLTLTFGFGPTLFTDDGGRDRFGLASRRPAALKPLPHFPGDALVDQLTGGDLCVQACSDDPQVAVHAVRNLARIAVGKATLKWSQLGYGRTSSTTASQATPRNLFGFKDGTANIKAEETDALDRFVWQDGSDQPWMAGGTYLVARRIRMNIETWDRTSLKEQEASVGRDKLEGAPLSGGTEFTEPDFALAGRGAQPLIDQDSHVRLAHPATNGGIRILRRGYNFVDGNDELGLLDAGLFFISFQRDPGAQFVPLQMRLAKNDKLNEYIKHVGSGVFAVPGGIREGSWIGEGLFA